MRKPCGCTDVLRCRFHRQPPFVPCQPKWLAAYMKGNPMDRNDASRAWTYPAISRRMPREEFVTRMTLNLDHVVNADERVMLVHLPNGISSALYSAARTKAQQLEGELQQMHRDEQEQRLLGQIDADVNTLIGDADDEGEAQARLDAFGRLMGHIQNSLHGTDRVEIINAVQQILDAAGLEA